jgi:hypothetical protein
MNSTATEHIAVTGADAILYRNAPQWGEQRTAAIGGFSCADPQAGATVLRLAAEKASEEGFETLIGPMDGDTWHRYRVVAESDGSPAFFLEPTSGPADREAFLAAGFEPVSSYVSARAPIASAIGDPAPAVDGVSIAAWDGRDAGSLIGGLFDLSRAAFTGNAFYKPLSREGFLKLYEPVLPAIDPRLVLFARRADKLIGFLFAIPDRLQGTRPDTAIIKTYASGEKGVGYMLADAAHRTIRDLGYQNVIHALMHVDNRSKSNSAKHGGTVFRRYDLMGLHLAGRRQ